MKQKNAKEKIILNRRYQHEFELFQIIFNRMEENKSQRNIVKMVFHKWMAIYDVGIYVYERMSILLNNNNNEMESTNKALKHIFSSFYKWFTPTITVRWFISFFISICGTSTTMVECSKWNRIFCFLSFRWSRKKGRKLHKLFQYYKGQLNR